MLCNRSPPSRARSVPCLRVWARPLAESGLREAGWGGQPSPMAQLTGRGPRRGQLTPGSSTRSPGPAGHGDSGALSPAGHPRPLSPELRNSRTSESNHGCG